MAIPESQLETWSHQGSVTQSSNTYQSIRRALLSADSTYANNQFSVFLQGSYGNDTNIYAESDVDVVIRLESIYRGDTSKLTPEELQLCDSQTSSATYAFASFKGAVISHLQSWFGARAITVGSKAIKIAADSTVEAPMWCPASNTDSTSHMACRIRPAMSPGLSFRPHLARSSTTPSATLTT